MWGPHLPDPYGCARQRDQGDRRPRRGERRVRCRRGRPDDRLYRGNVLDEARTWEGRNSANAREREFIDTSARTQAETLASEQKRQSQLRRAGIGVVALAIVLVLTFIGSLIFQIQTQAANNNTLLGERNRAESNLRDACDSQALFLADLSRQQLEAHAY